MSECLICGFEHAKGDCPHEVKVASEDKVESSPYDSHGYVLVQITRARIEAAVKITKSLYRPVDKAEARIFDAAADFLIDQFKVEQ